MIYLVIHLNTSNLQARYEAQDEEEEAKINNYNNKWNHKQKSLVPLIDLFISNRFRFLKKKQ